MNSATKEICRAILVSRPTVELTRRRESKHPPPHQASCETRYRRSRPTICSTATYSKPTLRQLLLDEGHCGFHLANCSLKPSFASAMKTISCCSEIGRAYV